ncbi:MAG: rod shape-determining protein MreC [Clostridia bacterium]|nr:rod shape-determining protein MreC [Clostridia bacterium]
MSEFFKGKKFKILVAIVAAVIAGSIFASVSQSGSSPVSTVVSVVFSPVQRLSTFVSGKLSDFALNFRSYSTYKAKVDELEKTLEEYQLQLIDYQQTKQKLTLYEEFLGVKEDNPDFTFEPATVISKDSADLFYSFVISKGSSDGIEVDDPVIFGKHLVGVIASVRPSTSVVRTIFDPKVNVSVYDNQSSEYGYVTSDAEMALKEECYLPGLERNTAITKGSVICTTGIGGIFPKDLIIGTVTDVLNDKHGFSSYAVIDTQVNIPELQNIFVLTSFNGQQGQTDE